MYNYILRFLKSEEIFGRALLRFVVLRLNVFFLKKWTDLQFVLSRLLAAFISSEKIIRRT